MNSRRFGSKFFLVRSASFALVTGLLGALAPAFAAPGAEPADGPKQAVVSVNGLACPFCAYGVRKHLLKLPGAQKVQVDLAKGEAVVDFVAGAKVTDAQIQKAVTDAGFSPGRIEWRGSKKAAGRENGLTTSEFAIEGIRCQYCAINISTVVEKLPGMKSVNVDQSKKVATVVYDAAQTTSADIVRAVEQAGNFHARLIGGGKAEEKKK